MDFDTSLGQNTKYSLLGEVIVCNMNTNMEDCGGWGLLKNEQLKQVLLGSKISALTAMWKSW